MHTLRQIQSGKLQVPLQVSWLLSDLGERVGKQELFTRQSPQRLKVLRENAIVQSAVSSNRIEGVVIDRKRVGTAVFGTPPNLEANWVMKSQELGSELGSRIHPTKRTIHQLGDIDQ